MALESFSNLTQPLKYYRFHPKKQELIKDFLVPKNTRGFHSQLDVLIPTVDLYDCEPCYLPYKSNFFTRRYELPGKGKMCKRKTKSGFWKSTCEEKKILDSETKACIGRKRTLVFYTGTSPGTRTHWIMYEFSLWNPLPNQSNESYVICFLKRKKTETKTKTKKKKNEDDPCESLKGESSGSVTCEIPLSNDLEEWSYDTSSQIGRACGDVITDCDIFKAPGLDQVVYDDAKVDLQSSFSDPVFSPNYNNWMETSQGFDGSEESPLALSQRLFYSPEENFRGTNESPWSYNTEPMPCFISGIDTEGVGGMVNFPLHQRLGISPNSS